MPEIVESVRSELGPLLADGIVSDVRMAGLVSHDGGFKPLMSVAIAGERPESHAAEISRLFAAAGLDVQWSITSEDCLRWPLAKQLVR